MKPPVLALVNRQLFREVLAVLFATHVFSSDANFVFTKPDPNRPRPTQRPVSPFVPGTIEYSNPYEVAELADEVVDDPLIDRASMRPGTKSWLRYASALGVVRMKHIRLQVWDTGICPYGLVLIDQVDGGKENFSVVYEGDFEAYMKMRRRYYGEGVAIVRIQSALESLVGELAGAKDFAGFTMADIKRMIEAFDVGVVDPAMSMRY